MRKKGRGRNMRSCFLSPQARRAPTSPSSSRVMRPVAIENRRKPRGSRVMRPRNGARYEQRGTQPGASPPSPRPTLSEELKSLPEGCITQGHVQKRAIPMVEGLHCRRPRRQRHPPFSAGSTPPLPHPLRAAELLNSGQKLRLISLRRLPLGKAMASEPDVFARIERSDDLLLPEIRNFCPENGEIARRSGA